MYLASSEEAGNSALLKVPDTGVQSMAKATLKQVLKEQVPVQTEEPVLEDVEALEALKEAEQEEASVKEDSASIIEASQKPVTASEMTAMMATRYLSACLEMASAKAVIVPLLEQRQRDQDALFGTTVPESLSADFKPLWAVANVETKKLLIGYVEPEPVDTSASDKAYKEGCQVLAEFSAYMEGFRLVGQRQRVRSSQIGTSEAEYSTEQIEAVLVPLGMENRKVVNSKGSEVMKQFVTVQGIQYEGYISNWKRNPPAWLRALMPTS